MSRRRSTASSASTPRPPRAPTRSPRWRPPASRPRWDAEVTGWRAGRVVLVVAGVLAALPTTAVGAAAVDAAGPPPPGLSAGSAGSDAMSPDGRLDGVDFDGLVRFTWIDRSGVHTARLPVQGAGGVVRVGGPGGARGVEWPADVGPPPSLSGKYTTREASGPTIAGRPTTVMQIWSGAGSSETLALDRATGDGPSADVTAAARSVPQPHQRSLLGRLGSWSREVVDTLSGSR